jgi:ATP-binding cassette, subfamily B, bacterial
MPTRSEFTARDAYGYSQRSLGGWIVSHLRRYWWLALLAGASYIAAWMAYAQAHVLIGRAVSVILGEEQGSLAGIALTILALLICDGISILIGAATAENLATRFEGDARQELYASLLGKSQSFHDRQRTGDVMARATDDASQLASMIVPGATLSYETALGMLVPLVFIGALDIRLLVVPLLFVALYVVTVRRYLGRLGPVIGQQRGQYGVLNATLEETISGIEVVKASAREPFERQKYLRHARAFRDLFVRQGQIEARYLPMLIYGAALGLTFLHALTLYRAGAIAIGTVISAMAVMRLLQFPVFISLFSFSVLQAGLASARRILELIRGEGDIGENAGGHRAPMAGEIVFEDVSFGYAGDASEAREAGAVLRNVSFRVAAGQTVAIVGQTGSGKTALTQLVNRTYDATAGRVLVDGVDVRAWGLDALRSQIAKIEQDVFLFSRSIRENIAFGAPDASQQQIEAAARGAQAHEFIVAFPQGYDTVIGERGVTLSGGQRQRIALARAFLRDPRVLILDDSTSAVDSATEDQIQQAIRQAQQGRTTLLITHRLSQIRWADLILVLDQGRLAAAGTHDELLRRSTHYRRIFARYADELPALEEPVAASG